MAFPLWKVSFPCLLLYRLYCLSSFYSGASWEHGLPFAVFWYVVPWLCPADFCPKYHMEIVLFSSFSVLILFVFSSWASCPVIQLNVPACGLLGSAALTVPALLWCLLLFLPLLTSFSLGHIHPRLLCYLLAGYPDLLLIPSLNKLEIKSFFWLHPSFNHPTICLGMQAWHFGELLKFISVNYSTRLLSPSEGFQFSSCPFHYRNFCSNNFPQKELCCLSTQNYKSF